MNYFIFAENYIYPKTKMRKLFLTTAFIAITLGMNAQNTEQLLLSGWRFQKGANSDAQAPDYDDSHWQTVTIPHDWAISGPFDKEIDKQMVAIAQNGEKEASEKTGRSGALPWIGEGWYRTTISIPEGYSHAELVFDGAMAEPTVYIDGKEAGYWGYGYNTFSLDITPYLPHNGEALSAGKHTLSVHLQNLEESSRWYPGAGLYRPVRLLLGQKTGVKTFGLFARTTRLDDINSSATEARNALLTVNTEVRHEGNEKSYTVVHRLLNAEGKEVAKASTSTNKSYETCQILRLQNAKLWSPEHPVLYTLITEIEDNGKVIDHQETKTGIRSIEYSKDGFKLNGQIRKFKGVCLHHDLGPLGAAFNKAAFRRQLRLLQDIGCDAIRTSHNMPEPWQVDICDEMGMLVMAESCDMWVYPKCKNGYARLFEQTDSVSPNADGRPWWQRDFENLVRVNRNHPSIVLWSIGNEIPDQSSDIGLKYTRDIQNLIYSLDPTRPCTQGLDQAESCLWSGVFQATEIPGYNYRVHMYDKGHAHSPKGFLLGSETASTVSSRGVYKFPVTEGRGRSFSDGQMSGYDLDACEWSNIPDDDWIWQDKAPWVIGEFVWTGFDYLGEPTPYDNYWPSRSSYFGIFDLAGLPKDRAFLYRVHWAPEKPTLHLLPHWTWTGREGEITPVFCYTSYPEAELFVNGKSQGRKRHVDMTLDDYRANRIPGTTSWGENILIPDPNAPEGKNRLDRYRLRWMNVKYEPGELKVVAYDAQGNKAAEEIIKTAGKPHHIELIADRSHLSATPMIDGQAQDTPDMAFVTVKVVDKDGNLCPDADNQLVFNVKGKAARFNSCCNGDATSTEVFTASTMKAFHGELVVVVEATALKGMATLEVKGKGLKTGTLKLSVE